MPDTEIRIVARLLDEHTEQDERSFASIREDFYTVNEKLDKLLVDITRVSTLQDVAKEAGAKSGRRAAAVWSSVVAIGVVALDKVMEKLF